MAIAGAIVVLAALLQLTDIRHYAGEILRWTVGGSIKRGYAVTLSEDEMYAVRNFRLTTDHADYTVPAGAVVPGITEVGVAVVVIVGEGTWTVREPGEYEWKRMEPTSRDSAFTDAISSIYLKIHPRFYDRLFEGAHLSKIHDPGAFEEALAIHRHKFWNSMHINERAYIPAVDIGLIDIQSATWDRLTVKEGLGIGPLSISPSVTRWDYKGDPPRYMFK